MKLKRKMAVGGFILILITGAIYFFLASSFFAVQKVVVVGASTLTGPEVVELAGIESGTNIFNIRTEDIKRRLLTVPAIAGVNVKRRLPGSVTLEIQERKPVAVVKTAGGLMAVDREGFCIAKADKLSSLKLPLITCQNPKNGEDMSLGERLPAEIWGNLLEIAGRISDFSRNHISEIHLDKLNRVSVYVLRGPEIRLGGLELLTPETVTERINMVEKIVALWYQGRLPGTTRYIDVSHQGFPVLGEAPAKN